MGRRHNYFAFHGGKLVHFLAGKLLMAGVTVPAPENRRADIACGFMENDYIEKRRIIITIIVSFVAMLN